MPDGVADAMLADSADSMKSPRLVVGASVDVHTTFNDSWSTGFEIDAVLPSAYRLRRTHDQALLPDATGDDDVRPARDRSPW